MQTPLRENIIGPTDTIQIETDTLLVWVRRPDIHHTNWWLCFYSTDANEAQAWSCAIAHIGKELGMSPFHQGTWPVDHGSRHPNCKEIPHTAYYCPGIIHAFEMWMGCDKDAIGMSDEPLEDIAGILGDVALQRVLASVTPIRECAQRLM